MATDAPQTSRLPADVARISSGLDTARAQTFALVAHLDDEELARVHSPIMSPLAWDLGHIAAYEDLWIAHRHGELPLLRPDLADLYDAFETPRAIRGEIEALGPAAARDYMQEVRERSLQTLARRGVGDGVVCEMVVRHELQHGETMRQTLELAGLLPPAELARSEQPLDPPARAGEWVEIDAGAFELGAGADGFAYDNERPRHRAQTGAFSIARQPVSNASWLEFARDGGYERREWWSAAGWDWLAGEDQTHDPAIASADPRAPACHISWFEADAFARSRDARLPREAEWEKAATTTRPGALDAVGRVWEWTRDSFGGYPGFRAHPYREYSEVFFGGDYRVLRGGSWATDARVANPHFRNWDLPQRRQIFAGVRLARDAV